MDEQSQQPEPESQPLRDPLHPSEAERERLRKNLQGRSPTRKTTGRTRPSSSAAQSGWTSLGDSAQTLQAQIAQIRAKIRRVEADERAQFAAAGGVCFACRDTGACDVCERGRLIAEHEREQAYRQRCKQLLADIPPRRRDNTLDSYPYQRLPGFLRAKLFLAEWDERRGLVLKGGFGTGKTGILVGLLSEIAQQWARDPENTHRLRFLTCPDLMGFLRDGFDHDRKDSYAERLYQLRTVRLLAIDDLGAERATDWVREQLFEIINHRYEHRLPTFITTNYGLDELAERIEPRVLERILEDAEVIDVDGPNLRRGAR